MGKEASRVLSGNQDPLTFFGQDRRGLGHEVDPTEHDPPGLRGRRLSGKLQRIAPVIRHLHDLVPLVMMG